jgi:hypothetical protein
VSASGFMIPLQSVFEAKKLREARSPNQLIKRSFEKLAECSVALPGISERNIAVFACAFVYRSACFQRFSQSNKSPKARQYARMWSRFQVPKNDRCLSLLAGKPPRCSEGKRELAGLLEKVGKNLCENSLNCSTCGGNC